MRTMRIAEQNSLPKGLGRTGTGREGKSWLRTISFLAAISVLLIGISPSWDARAAETLGTTSADVVAKAKATVTEYLQMRTWPVPTSGPKAVRGKNVWVISCGQSNPACAEISALAKAAGDELGWKTTTFDGNNGLNDAYSTGIRQAVAANAAAIVLLTVQCDVVKAALTVAQKANIPVVNVGGAPCEGAPDLQHPYPFFSAEINSAAAVWTLEGQIMAAQAIAYTEGKANVLYYNIIGVAPTIFAGKAMQKALEECAGCTFKQIDIPLSGLNPQLAAKAQADMLGNPDANVVAVGLAAIYDAGAGAGLVRSGRKLLVLSAGGSTSFYNSIKSAAATLTIQAITINQPGWGAMDEMNRILAGSQIVPEGGYLGITDATHNLPPPDENFDGPSSVNSTFFTQTFPYRRQYIAVWNGQ